MRPRYGARYVFSCKPNLLPNYECQLSFNIFFKELLLPHYFEPEDFEHAHSVFTPQNFFDGGARYAKTTRFLSKVCWAWKFTFEMNEYCGRVFSRMCAKGVATFFARCGSAALCLSRLYLFWLRWRALRWKIWRALRPKIRRQLGQISRGRVLWGFNFELKAPN